MADLSYIADPSQTLNALAGGLQFGQKIKALQDQKRINQLAGQAYQGDQSAIGQIAAVDPRAAQQVDQGLGQFQDRQQATLVNAARLLASAPDDAKPAIYQQMRQGLSQYIPNLPQEYGPEVANAANSIVQAWGQSGASGDPAGFREFQLTANAAGLKPGTEEYAQAARVKLGQDPRATSKVMAAQGGLYDISKGRATPITVGGTPNTEAILAQANQMAQSGVPEPHIDAWVQQQLNAGGQQLQSEVPQITPYQNAQLGMAAAYNARADQALALQQENAAIQRDQRSQAASQKAQQAQQAIETRQAQLQNVRRGIDRIKKALEGVDDSTLGSGPVAQYAQKYTAKGQELESAVGAIQNSMLSLTRVPGLGAQSDLEARIAGMIYPSLERDKSVNANTIKNLESFVSDLERTGRQSDQQDRGAAQQSSDYSNLWK